jgi:hypothetical protein
MSTHKITVKRLFWVHDLYEITLPINDSTPTYPDETIETVDQLNLSAVYDHGTFHGFWVGESYDSDPSYAGIGIDEGWEQHPDAGVVFWDAVTTVLYPTKNSRLEQLCLAHHMLAPGQDGDGI